MKKGGAYNWLWFGVGLIVIFLAFALTRLINLTIIPIFTDEAIYLRWAQIALGDPRWRFISLIDGKQPLLIWLFLPALKLISDPLVAGRLVSVLCGFFAMLGLGAFAWYMSKNRKAFLVAAALYILVPIFLVYDRFALYEALLGAIAIWSLFLTYVFAKTQRLDMAILLGTSIGAGLLTKSSANYFLLLLPVTLLLVPWPKQRKRWTLLKWLGLTGVVLVQSQIYNSILRLSEFRHIVGQKNLSFIYSFSEFIQDPLKSGFGNLEGLSRWFIGYMTVPVVILIIASFAWYFRKNRRETLFFAAYFLIPFVSLAFFGKVIYPRYLLFMIPPLLIPTSMFVVHLWQEKKYQKFFVPVVLVTTLFCGYFAYTLLTDPIHAPLPNADRQQFINDWPSGYGIPEVVSYLDEQSKMGKIIVGTEGTFGLFPMALEVYLGKNPNITFKPYWPMNEFPKDLQEDAKLYPTFLLFKERQMIPTDQKWPIQLIAEYQRGDGPTYLRFYRVIP